MANIDDRVVSMSFENAKFEQGVSTTMASLAKLSAQLAKTGSETGLENIEKSANKVQLTGLSGVIDRLKGRLGFGREAATGFGEIENASNKVQLSGANRALDLLKGKLGFPEADRAFASIERGSGRVEMRGLGAAIDGIGVKFGAAQTIALGALASIGAKAVSTGAEIVSSLTVAPVTGGLKEYETNLNSIQTILSNTKASGATLKDVNRALKELNHYADKTIYSFSEMAKNIGTFTAAGVDLETATGSIKGIANLAALSGSNSQQASTAMYQLSQAISSGRVSLQDWNSVVNAGMGGTVFQRALAQTAEQMGTLDKGAVTLKGSMKNVTIQGQSFRESIQAKPGKESWLTSDVLTSTLKQLSGDMTDAQLRAEGFSEAQIKAIQSQAQMAVAAATEVKTLSGVLETAKEAAGSGWAETWQLIFGDFEEAKTLFTGLSAAVNGMISDSAEARNHVLKDWKELGGRTDLIKGIRNIFDALFSVLRPLKEAFREIFPAKTGEDLAELTKAFRGFTDRLKIGPETAENLKRTFAGFFALLSIGKQIVFGLIDVFVGLFRASGDGAGGVLGFTGSVGDSLVALDKFLKEGGRLKKFFDTLGGVLSAPVELIGNLAEAIGGLFTGNKGDFGGGIASSLKGLGEALRPSEKVVSAASDAWQELLNVLEKLKEALGPAVQEIANVFSDVGDKIGEAISGNDFDAIFDVIQTTLIGGIFLAIKKAIGGGLSFKFGANVMEGLSDSLDVLKGSLVSMQNNIKSNTLLQISAAVALLAVSVLALSKVDPEDLASSMTAIAIGLGQLMGAMALLSNIGGAAGFAKIPVISAGLILLSAAIVGLSVSVMIFSRLSWDELARGLAGVAGVLTAVSLAMIPLTATGPALIRAGIGLTALGVGLTSVAAAVKIFSLMSWEQMATGLGGAAAALVAIGLAANAVPPSVLLIGPGLILVGLGLSAVGAAVAVFASMDVGTLAKGLIGIAAALTIIGVAAAAMPMTLPLTAAGLILVGIALTGIAAGIALFGNMDFGTLFKGITALAASLAVLAVGLTAMIASLPGAAALLVASAALAVFAPTLGILGKMGWGTIGKGLVAIGAAFLVIGTTGLIAAPALVALGAALLVLGAGVALVGVGVNALAKGLTLLGSEGSKGVAVVIAALTGLVAILPRVIIDFLSGLVKVLEGVAALAPKVVESMVKIINSMLDVVIKSSPKFAEAATAIILTILRVLGDNAGPVMDAGWKLLLQLLSGIADNIGAVTRQVASIVFNFLGALTERLPQLVRAGAGALRALLKGVADNITDVVTSAASIIARFVSGLGAGGARIVGAGFDMVAKLLGEVGRKSAQLVTAGASAVLDFVEGLGQNGVRIVKAGFDMVGKFITEVGRKSLQLVGEGADAAVKFVEGVEKKLKEEDYVARITRAGFSIGTSIVTGVLRGLATGAISIPNKLISIAKDGIKAAKDAIKGKSPSRVFMAIGKDITDGWSIGIEKNGGDVARAVAEVGKSLKVSPNLLNGFADMEPRITPILDLSQVKSEAQKLSELTKVAPIDASTSFDVASIISNSDIGRPSTEEGGDSPASGPTLNFEQTLHSPKALSEAEIYRQTKNQLSQAKDALGLL